MADDAVFSPADEGLSSNSGIGITMEEGSENSEELLDDEGEEDFEIGTNDLGDEGSQLLQEKNNDLENAIQQVLRIQRVDLENDGVPVLGIHGVDLENGNEHVLEFESNGHEGNSERMLEIPSTDKDSCSDQMLGVPGSDKENATDADMAVMGGQTDTGGKSYLPPVEGMEFESYDDAYNYYNCYAKELGFGIRVKSSWTKRNSKEKRGAVLCCNCEGFKTMKEASTRRKETRTGCLAMIRLRLVETNRWRLDEVKLEHNHLFDHQRAQNSRSHKKMEAGAKRKFESAVDVEVRTIKLYRTPAVDAVSCGSSSERELSNHVEMAKRLKLRNGDVVALYDYFRRAQLADPNFFYIMDLNDEGYARNVFWIDSRSRAAYGYFGDMVIVDSTCLSNKHDIPLLSFSGLNHHGQPILLGCSLLVDETFETYLWLMRAWLTCMIGRPPQTIITDQCKALQDAISEVFPRAHHCLCLPLVMKSIHEKLGEVAESEIFQTVLNRTVYNSMKVEEFEMAWEEMIQHFAFRDHKWLQSLYEDRERWVPVYLKDTFVAGIYSSEPGEYVAPFFHGYIHDQMTLNEFFSMYELLQQKKIQKEALDDLNSREFRPVLRTRCNYELQLSELYTKEIFLKFQEEVVLMSGCFSVTQIHANGPIFTYMIKERDAEGDAREAKNFEVVYDKVGVDVRCICSCFNFRGYLCRHALSVLSYSGVEEIPIQYILTRWRKDVERLYTPDLGSNNIDISNPVQWYDHLYRRAMQVVAEGMASQDHHMVAWQAFKESLNKVRLVAEKPV
ncbi:protein FAR1-RELATED SEQUENCE 8 isoform X1 [Sesamum indicum]|uniref:Protein FAR1-RELATED SEQUENCE n=2 Tax=Sesamum indicum TaxID=4182 RepID=A0A6I9SSE3_SESIN|nr:protein FAR1-RELATED SEQUENCE 8 isoform X1 [Sesamum indicum]